MTVPRSPGKLRVLVTRQAVSVHAPPLQASTAAAMTCQYASSMRLAPRAPRAQRRRGPALQAAAPLPPRAWGPMPSDSAEAQAQVHPSAAS